MLANPRAWDLEKIAGAGWSVLFRVR